MGGLRVIGLCWVEVATTFLDNLPGPINLVGKHQRRHRIRPQCLIELKAGTPTARRFCAVTALYPSNQLRHLCLVLADKIAVNQKGTLAFRCFLRKLTIYRKITDNKTPRLSKVIYYFIGKYTHFNSFFCKSTKIFTLLSKGGISWHLLSPVR